MIEKRIDCKIGFFQFGLAEQGVDLPVADAVQRLRFPAAAALWNKMMFVALIRRNGPAAKWADLRFRLLIPGNDVASLFSRHGAKMARDEGRRKSGLSVPARSNQPVEISGMPGERRKIVMDGGVACITAGHQLVGFRHQRHLDAEEVCG